MTINSNPKFFDKEKERKLINLHSEYPEVAITEDKKEVWIDDWLVWKDGEFIKR